MHFFVLVLISFSFLSDLVDGIRFAGDPPDVTTYQGQVAVLECQVLDKGTFSVYWYRVSQSRYISFDTNFYPEAADPRYSIVGNHHLGFYNLRIANVNSEDAGRYHCVIIPVKGGPTVFREVVLTINQLHAPDRRFPICSSHPPAENVEVGDAVTISCSSEGGIPPAHLTWFQNRHAVVGPSSSHLLTHTFTVEASHNGLSFTCSSSHPAFRRHRTCSVIPFHKPPTVNIQPSVSFATVGSTVNFTCLASGLPPPFEYSWLFAGISIDVLQNPRFDVTTSSESSILTIRGIHLEDDGIAVRCDVSNTDLIIGSATALLEVLELLTTEKYMDATTLFDIQTVESGETGMAKSNPLIIAVLISAIVIGQAVFIAAVYVGHRLANRMMKQRKDSGMPSLEAGVLRQAREANQRENAACSIELSDPAAREHQIDRSSHQYKSLHRYDTPNSALTNTPKRGHGIDTYSFSTSSFEEDFYHEVPSESRNHGYEVPATETGEQYVVMRPSLTKT